MPTRKELYWRLFVERFELTDSRDASHVYSIRRLLMGALRTEPVLVRKLGATPVKPERNQINTTVISCHLPTNRDASIAPSSHF